MGNRRIAGWVLLWPMLQICSINAYASDYLNLAENGPSRGCVAQISATGGTSGDGRYSWGKRTFRNNCDVCARVTHSVKSACTMKDIELPKTNDVFPNGTWQVTWNLPISTCTIFDDYSVSNCSKAIQQGDPAPGRKWCMGGGRYPDSRVQCLIKATCAKTSSGAPYCK